MTGTGSRVQARVPTCLWWQSAHGVSVTMRHPCHRMLTNLHVRLALTKRSVCINASCRWLCWKKSWIAQYIDDIVALYDKIWRFVFSWPVVVQLVTKLRIIHESASYEANAHRDDVTIICFSVDHHTRSTAWRTNERHRHSACCVITAGETHDYVIITPH